MSSGIRGIFVDAVGAEVIDPRGIAFGLDVDAVFLGVFGFQVAVVVGQCLPQVEEGAAFFQRDGSQLVVDRAQAVAVQAGVGLADFGADGRDGLDVDGGVGQRLGQHIQHQPVIGQEAGIIAIPVEDVGAQKHIEFGGLLGSQSLHGHFLHAVGPLAGGAVDHRIGADPLIGAEHGLRQAGVVDLHPLRQAVAEEAGGAEHALIHRRGFGQTGHPEIQRGAAIGAGLDVALAGGRITEGVPLIARQSLLEDGGLARAVGHLRPVQGAPQHPHDTQQDPQKQQCRHDEPPPPPLVQDPSAIFLIVRHKKPPVLLWGNALFSLLL